MKVFEGFKLDFLGFLCNWAYNNQPPWINLKKRKMAKITQKWSKNAQNESKMTKKWVFYEIIITEDDMPAIEL